MVKSLDKSDLSLYDLHKKCLESATRFVDQTLGKDRYISISSGSVEEKLWELRKRLFDKYEKYSYFNFGQPIFASLLINPNGVFVKILPVKDEERFREIYGLDIDTMKELIKKGLVIPIVDSRLTLFTESKEAILDIVDESIKRGLILSYYYEEFAKRITIDSPESVDHPGSLYDYAWNISRRLEKHLCSISRNIGWASKLGVNENIACEELKHNFFITTIQYKLAGKGFERLIFEKLMKDDAEEAIEFMYYNSTFVTDPIFYSPSRDIIADLTDLREGIIKLMQKDIEEDINKFVFNELNTVVYKGLALEMGISILKSSEKDTITITLDEKNISEVHHKIREVLKLTSKTEEIENYLNKALTTGEFHYDEFESLREAYLKEAVSIYEKISDKPQPGRKYHKIVVPLIAFPSIALLALIAIHTSPEQIPGLFKDNLWGFIGTASTMLNILDKTLVITKLYELFGKLYKRLDIRDKIVNANKEARLRPGLVSIVQWTSTTR